MGFISSSPISRPSIPYLTTYVIALFGCRFLFDRQEVQYNTVSRAQKRFCFGHWPPHKGLLCLYETHARSGLWDMNQEILACTAQDMYVPCRLRLVSTDREDSARASAHRARASTRGGAPGRRARRNRAAVVEIASPSCTDSGHLTRPFLETTATDLVRIGFNFVVKRAQPDQDHFSFRRVAVYSSFKSKVGLIAAKAAALRVNMNTDSCLIASHAASRHLASPHASSLFSPAPFPALVTVTSA
jgi:hypothetical protein